MSKPRKPARKPRKPAKAKPEPKPAPKPRKPARKPRTPAPKPAPAKRDRYGRYKSPKRGHKLAPPPKRDRYGRYKSPKRGRKPAAPPARDKLGHFLGRPLDMRDVAEALATALGGGMVGGASKGAKAWRVVATGGQCSLEDVERAMRHMRRNEIAREVLGKRRVQVVIETIANGVATALSASHAYRPWLAFDHAATFAAGQAEVIYGAVEVVRVELLAFDGAGA